MLHLYCIAGSFRGRELSRIGEKYDFHGEDSRRLLACATPKDATPPDFAEKTFVNSHKTVKFAKVFSLESFPIYSSCSRNCSFHAKLTQCKLLCDNLIDSNIFMLIGQSLLSRFWVPWYKSLFTVGHYGCLVSSASNLLWSYLPFPASFKAASDGIHTWRELHQSELTTVLF